MATSKPIASISYNTPDFLNTKISTLIKSDIIGYGMYICHCGELEEGEDTRDKDHIHIFLSPNRSVSLNAVRDSFNEIDKDNPDSKPLGCMPFRPSKEEEWLLYVLHYEPFLKLHFKGGDYHEKEFRYTLDDIVLFGINYEYLYRLYMRALGMITECPSGIIMELGSGSSPADLIRQGSNPVLVNQCNKALWDSDYSKLLAKNAELQNIINDRMHEKALLEKFIKQQCNTRVRFVNGKLQYVGDFNRWTDFVPKEKEKELSKVPSVEKPEKISAPVVSSSESVSVPVKSEIDYEDLLDEMIENV